jgi:predicted glycogen debranching enzyme
MGADAGSKESLLELGPGIVQQFERSAPVEWLETNGLGDFAYGTVAGPNTRRQHGLFTAFVAEPPSGTPVSDSPVRNSAFDTRRPAMLLLASLDVVLETLGKTFELSCHQYAGARHPEGFRRCTRFRADPFPEWRFEVEGAVLTRRLFMPRGARCVVNSWTLGAPPAGSANGDPWRLRVRPLCAFRESDALTSANDRADFSLRRPAADARSPVSEAGSEGGSGDGAFSIAPYPDCPEMFFHFGQASVKAEGFWYYRFLHPCDVALGLGGNEDLFSPCELTYELAPGRTVWLIAGVEGTMEAGDLLEARELERRTALRIPDMESDPSARLLARASEAFAFRDDRGRARIIAGYPEPRTEVKPAHASELRSALIALPGILLCMRRLAEARDFLDGALSFLLAPCGGAPGDEPLWFIRAAELYLDHSRDWEFLRDRLQPGCEALARLYTGNSSVSGYRLTPDGLLLSPDSRQALTWMDATMDDRPVTPRVGKPVEVNALWHHALGLLARWANRRNDSERARQFLSLRELAGKSFRHRFWNESEGCLFDVIDTPAGPADPAIRPNQIFAVSLPSDLLDRRQAASVLSVVEKRLLAPHGLRTLSLENRAFQPRVGGSAAERAAARHQGSIFPWLLGAYVDAVFRVHGRTPRARARARVCLQTLLKEHLGEACLGQVSELFAGAAPHIPHGASAHAPAVAELLRAYVETKGPGTEN